MKASADYKFTMQDEPFARGYLACSSECMAMKIASGMYFMAAELPLTIYLSHGLAGMLRPGCGDAEELGVYFTYGDSIVVRREKLREKAEKYPGLREEYALIEEIFVPIETKKLVRDAYTEEERKLIEGNSLWGGHWGGHANIDHGSFIRMGTEGVRERIAKYRPLYPDKAEWYDALELSMDAIDVLGERYRRLALDMAETAEDDDKRKLLRIAKALETVPKKSATDFFSAVQSMYLVYTFDGVDSPGYFDYYMYDYFKDADRAEAREILEGLWEALHDVRGWNLCVGGSDENWNDRTNELSHLIIDITREKGYQTPNLTLRWHRNTSDELLRTAAKCIAAGNGLPALYNDEAVCPALEKQGIPAADSHLYAMNGCNQIDIQGRSHMGLEDGEVFLLKCVEYALFDGVCQLTGEQLAPKTGDAAGFATYEELWEAFKKQVDFATETTIRLANRSQRIYAENAPNPLRSCLMQGCIESGRDYTSGGPIYNHGQILAEGLADAADCMTAIRHFVYDAKEITMAELLEALRTDFEGKEALRQKLLRYEAKFGNDNDEADRTAADIQKYFFGILTNYRTWRDPVNGMYGGGLSTFNRTGRYGRSAGASANGRHKGDPIIADSIGATPGFDRLGPTAALCSAMKYDHTLATSGFVMQLKFDKKWFNSPRGIDNFVTMVKAYFTGGGQQLSINVLDAEELLRAKQDPEHYENLIVRVGGYSDYFTKLEPALQDNIIARTIQQM